MSKLIGNITNAQIDLPINNLSAKTIFSVDKIETEFREINKIPILNSIFLTPFLKRKIKIHHSFLLIKLFYKKV